MYIIILVERLKNKMKSLGTDSHALHAWGASLLCLILPYYNYALGNFKYIQEQRKWHTSGCCPSNSKAINWDL